MSITKNKHFFVPGKYVPSISYKIHTENLGTPEIAINLKGLAVGNGAMSPPDSFIYGDYLFELGLVDEVARTDLVAMEQQLKDYAASEQWDEAWAVSLFHMQYDANIKEFIVYCVSI